MYAISDNSLSIDAKASPNFDVSVFAIFWRQNNISDVCFSYYNWFPANYDI
jgi:hypothetical protein